MAAVGRTLAKVSGTENGDRQEEYAPAPQAFDQSTNYNDRTHLEPLEPAP